MRSFGLQRFGELASDRPDFSTDHMEKAENCIGRINGYEPLPKTVGISDALTERAVGGNSYRSNAGTAFTYAGTVSKIFSLADVAWVDVSRVTPAYSPVERWEFINWADDVYAASIENQIQKITLGGSNFADLAGVNLKAAHIVIVRNQVMVGNVEDDDGFTPNRVRWSAVNNPDDWLPSQSTLAGFTQLESTQSGSIVRLIGGEFVTAFLERNIWRGSFTGNPSSAFQWDEVETGARIFNSGSVVEHDGSMYYLSEDGFRVTQGGKSQGLGEERIDNTVLADLDTNFLDRITSTVLTDDQVIIWAYPGVGNTDGACNKLALYNVGANRWSTGDEAVWTLLQARRGGRSIDDLDSLFGNLDLIPGSLDDKAFTGGGLETAAIGSDGILKTFTGESRAAFLETAENQYNPGRRSFISEIRPLIDAQDMRMSIGYRANRTDSIIETVPRAVNRIGVVEKRINSRFIRFRIALGEGWKSAYGIEPFGKQTGGR